MRVNKPQTNFQRQRKRTVEECLQLDSAWLTREQAFDPDGRPGGRVVWRSGWDQLEVASASGLPHQNRLTDFSTFGALALSALRG